MMSAAGYVCDLPVLTSFSFFSIAAPSFFTFLGLLTSWVASVYLLSCGLFTENNGFIGSTAISVAFLSTFELAKSTSSLLAFYSKLLVSGLWGDEILFKLCSDLVPTAEVSFLAYLRIPLIKLFII